MNIREREPGDLAEIGRRIRREKDADRRDRLRAVALALEGEQAPRIARLLGRSRRRVQDWCYAYRDRGLDAIHPPRRPGKKPRVHGRIAEALMARLDAGPRPEDGVCTLRGRDLQRILKAEHGVDLSLNAVYATLKRLGYSCLRPRPRHEQQDPARQEEFRRATPFFSAPCGAWPVPTAAGSACSRSTRPASGRRVR
jgi:transposase